MASRAAGEAIGTCQRIGRAQHVHAVLGLDGEGAVEGKVPLRVQRRPVAAQTDLGKRGELGRERDGLARAEPDGTTRVTRPIRKASSAATAPTGEDQIERRPLTDEPGQADGAAVDERHPPTTAEHAEHRVVGGDAQIAPEGELEATGDRVTLDRGDDGLA